MATTSYQTQLESVQAAIAAIEAGAQSYSISTGGESRSYTMADLDTLYQREEKLRCLAAREANGGGIRVRQVIPL